ncbi:MAG: thiamine-phosphate synthase family protein [Candidatus Thorarchaeota archaeon]
MRPPCELVQKEFLPAFRSSLASALHKKGMSQNQIAAQMDITQAAVSKYLNRPIVPSFGKKAIESAVQEIIEIIESQNARQDEMVRVLCTTCMELRIGGDLCHRHRVTVPPLGEVKCKICNDLLGQQNKFVRRAEILADMDRAIEIVEHTTGFIQLLPQVRASLVACSEDATTVEQVAGVPGRITDIKGRARAPAEPEYGASQHTASLLLWAKSKIPKTQACMCITGRDDVAAAVKKLGFRLVQLKGPASEVKEISELTEPAIKGLKQPPYAIQIPGGFGIEPVIYLFGRTATELAHLCESILEQVN